MPADRPRRDTAEDQLERILHIVPTAARPGGADLDELARALDVTAETVLRDIQEAAAGVFNHRGGHVEPFSISVEGRRVRVHAPDDFRRPVRLNAREALALGLGLRALAADNSGDPARRRRILDLARRLEATVVVPDVEDEAAPAPRHRAPGNVEYVPDTDLVVDLGEDGFRGIIADAIQQRRTCRILYLRPGDAGPVERRLAPWRLIHASGTWYVAAQDLDSGALRFFRMDRVIDAALLPDASPEEPDELAAFLRRDAPFVATDEIEVLVRYSPRVARWITERTRTEPAADGSVTIRHRVADPRWIVRHVLQYGGEAEVVGPVEARRWVSATAVRLASYPQAVVDNGGSAVDKSRPDVETVWENREKV